MSSQRDVDLIDQPIRDFGPKSADADRRTEQEKVLGLVRETKDRLKKAKRRLVTLNEANEVARRLAARDGGRGHLRFNNVRPKPSNPPLKKKKTVSRADAMKCRTGWVGRRCRCRSHRQRCRIHESCDGGEEGVSQVYGGVEEMVLGDREREDGRSV